MTPGTRRPTRTAWALACLVVLGLGAGPVTSVRVDNWEAYPPGPLDLSAEWRRYPLERSTLKHPPGIVLDGGRPVLQLMTDREALRIGRTLKVDLDKTPWLVWEWKPLVLPTGGDVRDDKRNDQAGRVMLVFEGLRGLLYVWDTTAPVGAFARSDELEMFQRVLVVVRSGAGGLGQWSRERRNVVEDYKRFFEDAPRPIKLVGLESHSNDTNSRTSVLFGKVHFEAR